jgi:translation initiation factor 2A
MPSNKKQKEKKDAAKPVEESSEPPTDTSDTANVVNKTEGKKQEPPKPPYIVYRSREGLKLIESFQPEDNSICSKETVLVKCEDKDDRIESVCCSEDGEFVAWCDRNSIKCLRFENQEIIFDQPNDTRSNCLTISPRSTKLVTFNTMAGGDNLHFWDLATQKRLASMPFKKASEWKPVFSMNEDICMQLIGGELVIYTSGVFDKPKHKFSHFKVNAFSLSSASYEPSQTCQHIYNRRIKHKNHYIAIYSAGTKGQPSIVKIYKYPNMTECITNKSFFKADSVKFSWSPSGSSLLVICQADFDKCGKSYYGEQSLNYLNVKGESYFVKLPKEGAISHIEWYPSCDQDMFICVYGLMPAKVSLFNNKCDVLFNFGDQGGLFNETKFNPFGNLLAVYGFGNLAGQLCIWDFDKKKLVGSIKVPETTGIEWCADGKHLLTSTTSPRLRVGNGFRLWHYTGSLLYENVDNSEPSKNLELYDVIWQPRPNLYKKPRVDSKAPPQPNLISQSKLSKFQASAGKYVPPSERNAKNR